MGGQNPVKVKEIDSEQRKELQNVSNTANSKVFACGLDSDAPLFGPRNGHAVDLSDLVPQMAVRKLPIFAGGGIGGAKFGYQKNYIELTLG